MKTPEEILAELKPLIYETGRFIQNASTSFTMEDVELKGLNDLVSYVDKEAEKKLVSGCRQILPESGFITEEETAERKMEEYTWIIDPLDGTTNFVHGLPVYGISVALLYQEKLLLGVVYEMNKNEFFHAIQGKGAYCNQEQIRVSDKDSLDQCLLATGFPYYDFGKTDIYLSILKDFMQTTHGLRRLGSAAVDLVYVACGRFEGFYEYNLNAWDVAAGALIVKEAGGVVCDFKGGGEYLFGRELIAGPAPITKAMQKTIASHWYKGN
jgi:myo-inositol-1(or 4)-monophosphatase